MLHTVVLLRGWTLASLPPTASSSHGSSVTLMPLAGVCGHICTSAASATTLNARSDDQASLFHRVLLQLLRLRLRLPLLTVLVVVLLLLRRQRPIRVVLVSLPAFGRSKLMRKQVLTSRPLHVSCRRLPLHSLLPSSWAFVSPQWIQPLDL